MSDLFKASGPSIWSRALGHGKTSRKSQGGAPGFTKFRNPGRLAKRDKAVDLQGRVVKRKNDPFADLDPTNTTVQSVMSG